MDEIEVDELADPDLTRPAMIEGLPGVGYVGKLAAEYFIEEFDSEIVRRVHTPHLPPKVDIDSDGVGSLSSAEFYAVDLSTPTPSTDETEEEAEGDDEADSHEAGERDLLVLTGNYQAQTGPGHYKMADAFLDIAEDFGCEEVYALGGVPTGELIEEYDVLGAASDADIADSLADDGVTFRDEEPAGGIVGVSGLLIGLGGRRDIDSICLMGETSGYLVDPKSSKAVIEVIQQRLEFGVDFDRLNDHAEEMEEVVSKIQEMQGGSGDISPEDELRYIG